MSRRCCASSAAASRGRTAGWSSTPRSSTPAAPTSPLSPTWPRVRARARARAGGPGVRARQQLIGAARAAGGAGLLIGEAPWRIGGTERAAGDSATIHRMAPQVYVATSYFDANAGSAGGGARVTRGTLYCHRCAFTGNSARAGGGAVALERAAAVVFSACDFTRNSAARGGALHAAAGSAVAASCVFRQNAAVLTPPPPPPPLVLTGHVPSFPPY